MNFGMKILHIITRLIVVGAQDNTLLKCEGLKVRGHEVTLLTGPSPGPEGTLMERARRGGYEVILTPNLVRAPNVFRDWMAYREIRRLVRTMKPDVVHTHSSKAGVVGRVAAWREKNLKFEISDLKEQNSIPNSDSNQKSKNQKSKIAAAGGAYDSWVAVSSVSELCGEWGVEVGGALGGSGVMGLFAWRMR